MKTPVQWISLVAGTPARGYWDQTILEDMFAGRLFIPEAFDIEHVEGSEQLPETATPILVVPGAKHFEDAAFRSLTEYVSRFPRAIVIISGDEASLLDPRRLVSDRVCVWAQNALPCNLVEGVRSYPVGYTPLTREVRNAHSGEKTLDWFFAGQVTHDRRRRCVEALRSLPSGELIETDGFLKGIPPREYLQKLAAAKIAPCPGGAVTPDTFRVCEALELGCVPLVDLHSGSTPVADYWQSLFGSCPLPFVEDWTLAPKIIGSILADWTAVHQRVSSWWLEYKRHLARKLRRDVTWLTGQASVSEGQRLSVIVATSPIASHPDTTIIDKTLTSVTERADLRHAEIHVMCDGVRAKQSHYGERYAEYRTRLLHKARLSDRAVVRIFETHQHQAAMTRVTLGDIDRPAILFLEHDTPLVNEIPFDSCVTAVCAEADLIRLHHESHVLEAHAHLMLDAESHTLWGLSLRRTVQWSQRPHVANTGFYRRILAAHFTPEERFMIEDRMHSVVQSAYAQHGLEGWRNYRLYMYAPTGDTKRSAHSDGRGADPKWVDE